MKLSPNFTLAEMLASQTATRKGITEQFNPPAAVIANLKFVANNLLEPVRAKIGPLKISSGYRSPLTNKSVGGAKNSQHLTGEAVDIDLGSIAANKQLFDFIRKSGLEFDQLINEYNFSWVHVSLKREGNRKQVLVIG